MNDGAEDEFHDAIHRVRTILERDLGHLVGELERDPIKAVSDSTIYSGVAGRILAHAQAAVAGIEDAALPLALALSSAQTPASTSLFAGSGGTAVALSELARQASDEDEDEVWSAVARAIALWGNAVRHESRPADDLMLGASGTLLAGTALHTRGSDLASIVGPLRDEVLARAAAPLSVGDNIGFAHGRAGCLYAVLVASAALEEAGLEEAGLSRARAVAEQLLEHVVSSLRSSGSVPSPLFGERTPLTPQSATSWCNGLSGYGLLARATGGFAAGTWFWSSVAPALEQYVRWVTEERSSAGCNEAPSLAVCHGVAGVLAAAGAALPQPSAERLVAVVISKSDGYGWRESTLDLGVLSRTGDQVATRQLARGLMDGSAGIALTLLSVLENRRCGPFDVVLP